MEEPIISLEHVNFWYDNGAKDNSTQALKDINININKGEYVAFFGPSGSGKTTLLYLLSGIEASQDGKILINGRDISHFSKQELAIYRQVGVGMVFQQFNLIPTLSVLNNVALPMSFLGVKKDRRQKEALRLLEKLAILHLANRFPHELSGGQQQRVGIARALANNAPIIIADEPLGNLDSENSTKVLEFLKELNEKDGRTIIMVTHEAWSLKDVQKIFYIRDGMVIKTESGKNKDLIKSLSKQVFGELNPKASEKEIAADSLSSLFLRGYSDEELKLFKSLLMKRLAKEISAEAFRFNLDKPFRSGGVGLWWQKAVKISDYVEQIITEQTQLETVLKNLEQNPEMPFVEEVKQIRSWLLEGYKGALDNEQADRMDEAIIERLKQVITAENFLKLLNVPKSKFGIGLSRRLANTVAYKFELATKNNKPEPATK
jgi:putative ABC transport system ATP-binding protein